MATLKELLGDSYREGMTFEDIENVINTKKLADLSSGDYVSTAKYNDILNKNKDIEKKLNAKLTEEEKANREQAEIAEKYKAMEKENRKYKYREKLSASIEDSAVLDEIAQCYADDDVAGAIEKTNAYYTGSKAELEKKIKAEMLKANPQPTPNNGGAGKTYKEMTLDERIELKDKNPELYEQLKNKN